MLSRKIPTRYFVRLKVLKNELKKTNRLRRVKNRLLKIDWLAIFFKIFLASDGNIITYPRIFNIEYYYQKMIFRQSRVKKTL